LLTPDLKERWDTDGWCVVPGVIPPDQLAAAQDAVHHYFPSPPEAAAEGGAEAGKRFINALEMFYHVANIGDSRSLAIHQASTTHSQLAPEDQLATGVTPGYVRLSVGIEHIDDILADLTRALEAA